MLCSTQKKSLINTGWQVILQMTCLQICGIRMLTFKGQKGKQCQLTKHHVFNKSFLRAYQNTVLGTRNTVMDKDKVPDLTELTFQWGERGAGAHSLQTNG